MKLDVACFTVVALLLFSGTDAYSEGDVVDMLKKSQHRKVGIVSGNTILCGWFMVLTDCSAYSGVRHGQK